MILFTANRKNYKRESAGMMNSEAMLLSEEFALDIKGCALNKRDSQKKIYTTFYSQALVVCEGYANTYDEAIEILNKGFLKIFKQIVNNSPAFANEMSSFLDWLLKIMADEAIDHYYRRNNKHHVIAEPGNNIYSLS
jgi:RNA polymerase sigma-70 factor (ECF subfamily)